MMRNQLRAFATWMSQERSTEGYSQSVNSRQHLPRVRTLVAAAAVVFGAGLYAPEARADDPPKKADPKAAAYKLKAALKEAADDILPVQAETPKDKARKGLVVLQRA